MILKGETYQKAKVKFEQALEKGRQKATQTVESIVDEFTIRKDLLAGAPAIQYQLADRGNWRLPLQVGKDQAVTTEYSTSQLLSRIGLPRGYVEAIYKADAPWADTLLLRNLREFTDHALGTDRLLFRMVRDQVKGVLSSAYRRMDASPIFEAFIRESMAGGFLPLDGRNTDTRYHIKMIKNQLFEPVPGEIIAFGLCMTTSDYGNGALDICMIIMRVGCINLAIGESVMRKVHIGRRFEGGDDGEVFELSQDTYDLDTKTVASATKDIIAVAPKRIENYVGAIKAAAETEVDHKKIIESFRKKGVLTKDQAQAAAAIYENAVETEMLPAGNSAWRLSNVLSLMAQNSELAPDRSLDLQEAAAELVEV